MSAVAEAQKRLELLKAMRAETATWTTPNVEMDLEILDEEIEWQEQEIAEMTSA